MKIVKPSVEILSITPEPLKLIELAGRTCYKSEDKITEDSSKKFVQMLIDKGHESVLEHAVMTVKIICDRGVSHELVRHRLASYSQESTRYCNYKNEDMEFILPCWLKDIYEGEDRLQNIEYRVWEMNMSDAEEVYNDILGDYGRWIPQQARVFLPNSLKTEIVMTANFREWRNIFKQRCSNAAHPQMREIMIPLLQEVAERIPVVFDDIVKEIKTL